MISKYILLFVFAVLTSSALSQEEEPEVYAPPRDYGTDWRPSALIGYSPEDGLLIGGGPILYKFGFRKMPYVFRMQLTASIGLRGGAFAVDYSALYPAIARNLLLEVTAHVTELEIRNFYGFGNDSYRDEDLDRTGFYRLSSREYLFRNELSYSIGDHARIGVGALFKHFEVRQKSGRYLTADSLNTLGDDRSYIGTTLAFTIDTRNSTVAATRGVYLRIQGDAFPDVFKDAAPYYKLAGDARISLSAPLPFTPTLAVRVGGGKMAGNFPFYEAAFLGGRGSLRGFNAQRFTGDASAFANIDLRLSLFRMRLIVPTTVGVFGLADAGRVWVHGASPQGWHVGVGGGISLAPLSAETTFSLALANSKDGLFIVGGLGYGF